MNDLQLFNYEGRQVRTIVKDGDTWFVARDVCDVLEIGNACMAMQRLSEQMKGVNTIDTLGGAQNVSIINEAGLYKLAFTSRKEAAEKFTDWVASEVLPSIRKTGSYSLPQTDEMQILRGYNLLMAKVEAQQKQIDEMKPIVEVTKAIEGSTKTFTMAATGKILSKRFTHIGPRTIFAYLRGKNILMGGVRWNQPRQEHVNAGRFEVKRSTWQDKVSGEIHPCLQTMVTQKGLDWITDLLIRDEIENHRLLPTG